LNNNHLPRLFLVLRFDVRILSPAPLTRAGERVPAFHTPIKEMMIIDEFLYDVDSEILTLQFDSDIRRYGGVYRAWQDGVRFKLDPEIAKQVMVNASLPSDLLRAAFVISIGIDDKGEFQTPVDDFGGGPEQPYGAFFLQPTVLHECIVFRRDTGVILHKEY